MDVAALQDARRELDAASQRFIELARQAATPSIESIAAMRWHLTRSLGRFQSAEEALVDRLALLTSDPQDCARLDEHRNECRQVRIRLLEHNLRWDTREIALNWSAYALPTVERLREFMNRSEVKERDLKQLAIKLLPREPRRAVG